MICIMYYYVSEYIRLTHVFVHIITYYFICDKHCTCETCVKLFIHITYEIQMYYTYRYSQAHV